MIASRRRGQGGGNSSEMPVERDWLRRAAPFIVVAVAIAVYLNATANGFTLDDGPVVLRNQLIHALDGVWRAFAHPYWPPPEKGGQYRPFVISSFALDWWLSGGSAAWLHLTNILWHAAAALLLYFFAREILAPTAALATGLLFAVHPVHVEAVSNLVGRSEPMAATFVLAMLMAHRRGRWWAPLLFVCGLLAKESAIVGIGLVAMHDLLLENNAREAYRRRARLYAGYGVILVAYATVLFAMFHGRSFTVPAPTFIGASTGERLLTVATIVPHYVRLLLFPMHLSGDYYPQVIELATGVTPAACIGILLAVALGIAVRRAWRPAPEFAFALCWVPIAIAPTSNVLFPSVVLAERTLYLASAGACLALGFLVQLAARSRTAPVLAAAGVLIGLFAVRSWTRTPVWKNDKAYTIALLRDHPESYRAHLVAGRVLARQGQLGAAASHFEEAYRLFPADPAGAYEAGVAYIGMGRLAKADSLLSAAALASPNSSQILMTRADLRVALQDFEGAILDARRALQLAPDSSRAVVIMAVASRSAGLFTLADSTFRVGIAEFPDFWQLRLGYADLLLARGDSAAARVQAAAALEQSAHDSMAVAMSRRTGALPPRGDSMPDALMRY